MKQELIGKNATITTNNKTFIGKIINETKNLIYLKTKTSTKKLLKTSSKIKITGQEIDGNTILKRPEERIKSC